MVNPETIHKLPRVLRPVSEEQGANAAVALILKPKDNDFEILLVKRAKNPADPWSGQIALPGGKRDPKDQSLKATVTRETLEETGINLENHLFLGVSTVLESEPKRGLCILPFIILLQRDEEITLNRNELEAYMWIPYERIIHSKGTFKYSFARVPAFLLEKDVVWGITHRILSDFNQAVQEAQRNNG